MTNDVPLVASLFVSLFSAAVLALIAFKLWSGFVLAAFVYSFGGAAVFVVAAGMMALRLGQFRNE